MVTICWKKNYQEIDDCVLKVCNEEKRYFSDAIASQWLDVSLEDHEVIPKK
jgi:hypothetical protein